MSGWDRYIDLVYCGAVPDAMDYYTGRAQLAHVERDLLAMRAVDELLAHAESKQAWGVTTAARLRALWPGLTLEVRTLIVRSAELLSR